MFMLMCVVVFKLNMRVYRGSRVWIPTCLLDKQKPVCDVLKLRNLESDVVESFRRHKIDGTVVGLLNSANFESLGLSAFGDRLSLLDFWGHAANLFTFTAQPEGHRPCTLTAPFPTDVPVPSNILFPPNFPSLSNLTKAEKTKRKQELLELLKMKKNQQVSVNGQRKDGRPKAETRKVMLGLRIKEEETKQIRLVRSPLGDQNFISLQVPVQASYSSLLGLALNAFFPGGKNPVIGELMSFQTEMVNSLNQNLESSLKNDFSLQNYTNEKMVSGSLKFYLLCSANIVTVSSDESSGLEDSLLDAASKSELAGASHGTLLQQTLPLSRPQESVSSNSSEPDHDFLPDLTSTDSFATVSLAHNQTVLHGSTHEPSGDATVSSPYNQMNIPKGTFQPLTPSLQRHLLTVHLFHLEVVFEPLTPSGEIQARMPTNMTESPEYHTQHRSDPGNNPQELKTVKDCIQGLTLAMDDVKDPVQVLQQYQAMLMQKACLEPDPHVGLIEAIFVSRYDLFTTSI